MVGVSPPSNQSRTRFETSQQSRTSASAAAASATAIQQRNLAPGTTWLTGLQLLAVQPAACRAHPLTPLPPGQAAAAVAAAAQHPDLQHELLLHLEATLTRQQPAAVASGPAGTPAAAAHGSAAMLEHLATHTASASSPLPLVLAAAQLQVLALSRQMQLLHRQRASLLQLLQQHGQLEAEQMVPAAAPGAVGSSGSSSSSSASDGHEHANGTTPTSDAWTVLLNLHVTLPCWPTDRLLDCVHLLLVVGPSSSDQQAQAGAGAGAPAEAAIAAAAGPTGATGVVADVVLLVMPAAAQQEVQQLLLPAMRQEVQAAQQQQQLQQQHDFDQQSAEDFARMSMAVEHGAWQHYRQMANDVYAVVQLSAAAAAEAPAVQEADGVLGNAEADNEEADGVLQGPVAEAGVVVVPHNTGAEVPAAAAQAASPAAALQHLAEVLLFPLLLPFLATQGLHNMLRLLLMCLPHQLQWQWQQQQFARLQYLVAAAPAPLQLPAMLVEQQQPQVQPGDGEGGAENHNEQGAAEEAAPVPAAAPAPAAGAEAVLEQQEQGQQQASPATVSPVGRGYESDTSRKSSSSSTAVADKSEQNEQGCKSEKGEKSEKHGEDEAAELPAAKQKGAAPAAAAAAHSTAGTAQGGAAGAAAAGAAAAAGVAWYVPLTQFGDGGLEQRYLSWKHHNLLQVDYLAALFEVLYLAVLLRRMMSEPMTVFYFLFIFLKTLPHVPLMMGLRNPYLRHRELWLLLVAPITALMAICLSLPAVARGQPPMLLPNRAYRAYWASRGELQTNMLRPFLQHMRVRPYLVYTLIDALISVWVFAQVFGVWAVVERWSFAVVLSIGLCWGLDLYMRRRFMGALSRQHERLQQQQQLLARRPHQD